MPTIYDNRAQSLAPALRATLGEAISLDVCVGYLNLRGWRELAGAVDSLPWDPGTAACGIAWGATVDGTTRRRRPLSRPEMWFASQ